MAAMTDFLENKLIDFLFRAQALGITGATAAAATGPASLHVGLLTAAPADGAAGTEVTGGSYARVLVTSALGAWDNTQAASSAAVSSGATGTTRNQGAITFPAPTANWGVVTHVAIYDAASAGNMLIYSALTVSKTVNNGDAAPSFAANALTFQIDN